MPTGGIIFLTILALWAFYLVPVLIKERASRLDSRAGDRISPAVRVLQRPPAQRPSHRVVLTADRPVVSDDLPARPTRDLAAQLSAEARTARVGVRARAGAALVGVVALFVAGLCAVLGALPGWTVAVAGVWLAAVLGSGAVAAAARRQAATAPVGHVAALPPRAHRVATEVFDGRVARLSTPSTPSVPVARAVAAPPAARTGADVRVDVRVPGEEWTPVDVPTPVYVSKPVSRRPPTLPWSMPPAAQRDDARTTGVTEGAEVAEGAGVDVPAAAEAREVDLRAQGPVEHAGSHDEERRSASA